MVEAASLDEATLAAEEVAAIVRERLSVPD